MDVTEPEIMPQVLLEWKSHPPNKTTGLCPVWLWNPTGSVHILYKVKLLYCQTCVRIP